MTNLTMIITLVSLAAMLPAAVIQLVRLLHAVRALGLRRTAFPRQGLVRYGAVLAAAPVLASLTLIRSLGFPGTLAVCGVALLGFMTSAREFAAGLCAGVYENGFVFGGMVIKGADIDLVERGSAGELIIQLRDRTRKHLASENIPVIDSLYDLASQYADLDTGAD